MIFVDGASSATGSDTSIILENEEGTLVEVSLTLSFPTSNNQAEYEAFLTGLQLTGKYKSPNRANLSTNVKITQVKNSKQNDQWPENK